MLPLLSAIAMHCLPLNSALMLVLLLLAPCCQEATDEVLWGWSGAHQGCTTLPQPNTQRRHMENMPKSNEQNASVLSALALMHFTLCPENDDLLSSSLLGC